jgi:hypothetical protein
MAIDTQGKQTFMYYRSKPQPAMLSEKLFDLSSERFESHPLQMRKSDMKNKTGTMLDAQKLSQPKRSKQRNVSLGQF